MGKEFKKVIKESVETKINAETGEVIEITDKKEY